MNELFEYKPPSWDEYFMKQVYLVAEKSKDPSTKFGAVLVKDKRVIATGYNGFPIGVHDDESRYNDRPIKYAFVVHAEANSVLSCARFGISSEGSTLYTQSLPCNECMKSIIQGGITSIVVHKMWPDTDMTRWEASCKISSDMVKECGIIVDVLETKLGMVGYVNGKIIQV